jgi:ATP-dependent RNA helicase DDX10/DBP4
MISSQMQGDLEGPSAGVAALGGTASDDDGYVSPEFDLPSEDEDEHEEPRPNKKRKQGRSAKQPSAEEGSVPFEDDEELALRLLRQGR